MFQEGKYLAQLLNNIDAEERAEQIDSLEPFSYQHFGSLAYVGDDSAVADMTGSKSIMEYLLPQKGRKTFWLWRSFYLSEMFTTRTRLLLAFDWMRTWLFGRDISRV